MFASNLELAVPQAPLSLHPCGSTRFRFTLDQTATQGAPKLPVPCLPLQRMERLGTAWFGTIFELDGVCIEYECGDGGRSWQALAAEEGKQVPPLWALKKARGMKNEQVR